MAHHLIASNATIKAVRPRDPRNRLSDGAGLHLRLFVKAGSHDQRSRDRQAEDRATAGLPPDHSFEAVARQWRTKNAPTWATSHSSKAIRHCCPVKRALPRRFASIGAV
jgi:hypothetical protein